MSCEIHPPGYDKACNMLPLISGKSLVIIDVGCGSGIKLKAVKHSLKTHGKNVRTVGIDPDGAGRFLDEFTQEDVRTVKPYKGVANLVICMRADGKDTRGLIQACVKMLKPDGFLIMNSQLMDTTSERIRRGISCLFKAFNGKVDTGITVRIMSKHEAVAKYSFSF